jgi:pimeloyl-ACP methyl ester carboxylesterase
MHVVTLAGFAGVPPTDTEPFLSRTRDAILQSIRDEGLERPALVGHSLGAFLALWIAATAPERMGPVIAMDGVPFLPARPFCRRSRRTESGCRQYPRETVDRLRIIQRTKELGVRSVPGVSARRCSRPGLAGTLPASPATRHGHSRMSGNPRNPCGEPLVHCLAPPTIRLPRRCRDTNFRSMRSRFRTLAALLALFAFSAYFAEGVWASLCLPGAETQVHMAMDATHHGSHAAGHHAPAQDSGDPDPSRSDAPSCPLGMTGMGSSCVVASLPASTSTIAQAAPEHAEIPLFLDSTHDRLLVASLFRPPRA